jgi:ribosomal protein S18 acetylase RimI-like enzyme
MRIETLTIEKAEEYHNEIAQLYFDNVRSNAFHEHYILNEAYEKIGSLIDHLRDDTAIVYGAFHNTELVGFIWAYVHQFREEPRMYVSEIRVKEEYRKRGIGSQLLRLIEDRAKEKGLPAIYLHVEARNREVRRLYEACGYVEERIQMRKGNE